jgi:hypothetical protein
MVKSRLASRASRSRAADCASDRQIPQQWIIGQVERRSNRDLHKLPSGCRQRAQVSSGLSHHLFLVSSFSRYPGARCPRGCGPRRRRVRDDRGDFPHHARVRDHVAHAPVRLGPHAADAPFPLVKTAADLSTSLNPLRSLMGRPGLLLSHPNPARAAAPDHSLSPIRLDRRLRPRPLARPRLSNRAPQT